tara:strand:+ start:8147 stop:11239 length:3093 start_codon:yes stop_codon:yes gene_type:complete
MRKLVYLLFCLILSATLLGQEYLIAEARFLFQEERYGAAQSVLNEMLNDQQITAEVMYLNARCSKELLLDDAIFLYTQLNEVFPYHPYKDDVNKDMGLIYYRKKEYFSSIICFSNLKQLSNEYLFKLAYSYFSVDSLEEAQLYFSKIIDNSSKFGPVSQYYYACIAYEKGLYKSALENFKKLINHQVFGSIVPYYITQIYYFQKEYKQLIDFAEPLLEDIIASRKSETHRCIAEAYYKMDDFINATHHFEASIEEDKERNPLVYYLLGHSYFKLGDYENAISHFENVTNSSDSLMQYSSYFLGASYLRLEYYNYALQAFKRSSSYNYNVELQEDAFYNCAKLSYQIDLPFENTLEKMRFYLENFNHPTRIQIIQTLMAKTLQSTSQFLEAYSVLKDIDSPSLDQKQTLQQLSFFLGVKEFNKQNFKSAISYFVFSNEYPINDGYYYLSNYWVADCYFHLGDYQKSVDIYNSLTIAPGNISDYQHSKKYNLAYSYFQDKDYINAVKWFLSYEKIATDSMKITDTYLRIADGYFMSSNFDLSEKYYAKAVSANLFDTDYALYQQAVSLGLIGDDFKRIKLLEIIVADFPSSSYYTNSLYDLARYYKNTSNYDLAVRYYDSLLSSNNDDLIADAYLSKGIIYFNSGMVELAIENFLLVVNDYQKTKYFKEALLGLQSAYASIAKIQQYLEVVESLPEISITKSEQDSLMYNTAFMKFSEMDYIIARTAFDSYLENFPKGVFVDDATYYNAISALKIEDTASAVYYYERVVVSNSFSYHEDALKFLARRTYKLGDFIKSNTYYVKLLDCASSNSIKREALIRLMLLNEYYDKMAALSYAKQVIELNKVDDWLLSKAYIIIAREEFEAGNYAKSKLTFEKVTALSAYDEGAEGQYYLAFLTYLDDDLILAEELIFALSEHYSSDHFIAKAFVLLSDVYMKQGNIFQARATLESIIKNHDDEDLVNIAREKWELIVEMEKELVASEVLEESFIEISEDDIEYEVEQIDENYIVPMPVVPMDSLKETNKKILENEFE